MQFTKLYIFVFVFTCCAVKSFSQYGNESKCKQTTQQLSAGINFPRFARQITISKDTIKFDSSCIIIESTSPELISIFESGIIFPDLIFGASTRGDKYEFKNNFRADTFKISNVSEISFPNQNVTTKWFSFLYYQPRTIPLVLNPSLYLFELTDENAESKAEIKNFIKNARVTSFGFCSILI